jgi:hypothetical protein
MEVTIVDDPSESTMSAAELEWRANLQKEILDQMHLRYGAKFSNETEIRMVFGLALSTTDELITVARASGIVPPPRNF